MPSVEKISIALTPDLAALVKNVVDSGYYSSASEVIREALRDWRDKQHLQQQKIAEIRKMWQEGIDSGSAGYLDIDEIKLEARRKYQIYKVTRLCLSGLSAISPKSSFDV